MKKILLSLGMIVFVGVVVAGATGAFFSDTETSTGNTFTAGAIDLQIDNESFLNGVANSNTSWFQKDLESGDFFFDFSDVKPGDYGEDTISIHVNNNDAYACVDVRLDANDDNGLTEPEGEDGDTTGGDGNGKGGGELASHIDFLWWVDDGDNVLETDEKTLPAGPLAPTLGVGDVATVALAEPDNGGVFGGALPGDEVVFLAKAWCFGDISAAPLSPSNYSGPDDPTNAADTSKVTPEDGGFTCSGASSANNITQSDSFEATISFFAEQARNNDSFSCQPHLSGGVQRPTVGALLSAYVQPTGNSCTTNVTDITGDGEIQVAIDAASNGDVICVGPGTYNEDVVIDKEITLSGDGASATSVINGQAGGQSAAVRIAANNVIVEGFEINGAGIAAIYIAGARDNITVQSNKVTAATGKNAFVTEGGQSNHTISNNVFEGNASQLVYVNGNVSVSTPSTNVDFTNNTFGGTATGPLLGNEANSSSVTLNKFSGITSYTSLETFEGDLLVNQNNFNADSTVGPIHVVNAVVGGTQFPGTLNAENNWWGDTDPSDNVTGSVDFTSSEAIAFPEN